MKKIKVLTSVLITSTLLMSCMSTRGLTAEEKLRQTNIENQLEWLYWEYSNKRDSLLIEYYKE